MKLLAIAIAGLVMMSCDTGQTGGPTDTFDRAVMLRSMASGFILPQYDGAVARAEELDVAVRALATEPSADAVRNARSAWLSCAMQWQRTKLFDFGPAEGRFGDLVQTIGTFPSNVARIEALIAAGDTSTSSFERDVRGINSLDYLLFGRSEDQLIAALQTQQPAGLSLYMLSVTRHIVSELRGVRDAWRLGYADLFVSRSGTDAGSSISLVANNLAMSFEFVKNSKIGLPAGLMVGQRRPEPLRVEAYYSSESLRLARNHVEAIRLFWEGKTSWNEPSESFTSVRHYLAAVVGGPRLVEETRVQFDNVDRAFEACNGATLAALCGNNDPRIVALHVELQKLTRFLKSELSSLLGVAITYSSGDGD